MIHSDNVMELLLKLLNEVCNISKRQQIRLIAHDSQLTYYNLISEYKNMALIKVFIIEWC